MSAPVVLFYGFALLAVAGAIGTVANTRNLVAAAMALVVTLVSLAGIYTLLGAHLVAVFQIIVQGGAIAILLLFIAMLLDLPERELPPARHRLAKIAAVVVAAAALTATLRAFSGLPVAAPAPVRAAR